jgi:uncharacterized protein YdcH (DUF465 family)
MKEISDRTYYILALVTAIIVTVATFYSSPLFAQKIKVGVLAQMKIVENQNKINRLIREIDEAKKENEQIFIDILKANNVSLKDNESVSLDTNNWTLTFK